MTAASETAPLVAAARGGDRSAFEELYRRYAGMVYAIAIGRVPPDCAADVVQDVFLRALARLPTLRDDGAFGSWVAAIARNVTRDAVRRLRASGALDSEPVMAGAQHEAFEAAAALRAIRGLPAAYRETLMMRLVQGMTGHEIAQRTGLSPGSVRVNLHRGMKLLRARLRARANDRR